MAKHGKRFRKAEELYDRAKDYSLTEAVALVKKAAKAKFDETVDMCVVLGVDPKQADQNVRGTTPLPHGTGKNVRIVVFAKGDKVKEAQAEGVEFVGADDLVQKITDGWMDFDQVIATPDLMGQVGRLGKVLGPRGLMPNPKLGTVTFDVTKAIRELKAGRAEFRVDKAGIVHCPIAKASFSEEQIEGNIRAVMDAVGRAKPASSKGQYLRKMVISSTMGPGVKVDLNPFRT